MHLPVVLLGTGGAVVGAQAELHYQHRVTIHHHRLGIHIVDAVQIVAVAAKEVNLRTVGVGVTAAKGRSVRPRAGQSRT